MLTGKLGEFRQRERAAAEAAEREMRRRARGIGSTAREPGQSAAERQADETFGASRERRMPNRSTSAEELRQQNAAAKQEAALAAEYQSQGMDPKSAAMKARQDMMADGKKAQEDMMQGGTGGGGGGGKGSLEATVDRMAAKLDELYSMHDARLPQKAIR